MDTRGYYAMLGVSENAKYSEIRAAYRRLAKRHHPDVSNSLSAEETIKKINEAFEVLSDKEKRRQYDDTYLGVDNSNSLQPDNANNYSGKTDRNKNYSQSSNKSEDNSSKGGRGYYSNSNYRHHGRRNVKIQSTVSSTPADTLDTSNSRFHVIVEPSLCMAFGSCETLAPKVFVVEKDKIFNPKARVVSETAEDFDSILSAAQTCPTKAIIIIDRTTGERIYP